MERKHLSPPDPGDLFLRSNLLSTWHPFSHFLAARGCGRPKPPSRSLSCERNPSKPWAVEAPKMQCRWLGLQLGFGGTGTRVFAGASMSSLECWVTSSFIEVDQFYVNTWSGGWIIYITSLWPSSNERRRFLLPKFQRGESLQCSLAVLWYIWCYWKLCTFKNLWNPCFRRLFVN